MSLASYTPEARDLKVGDKVVCRVTGLSLTHIEILVRAHLEDIEALFELFMSGGGNFGNDDLKTLGVSLVTNAPGFVANVIALASGEEDATAGAARLPMPAQLQAMSDIMELTFTEVGGIKKFMETVATLLGSVRAKAPQLTKTPVTPSPESSGSTGAFVAT